MAQMGFIGQPKEALDTPVLLVDMDVLDRNIERMARTIIHEAGVGWRPHTKGVKTPALAHRMLQAGAVGITCAKLGEAEVMADAGIQDILIANEVVGAHKIPRLMDLARHCDIMVALDDERNLADIARAAGEAGVKPRVLVEVNIGHDRCGVASLDRIVELSRLAASARHLRFCGIMGYEGHVVDLEDREARESGARECLQRLVDARAAIEAAGLPVEIVSSSATGDYYITTTYEGITEVQAGSYALMDAAYGKLGLGFQNALTVLTTVTNRPTPGHVITDAGLKSVTPEHGLPDIKLPSGARGPDAEEADLKGLRFLEFWKLSEEHGRMTVAGGTCTLEPGDVMEFIPGHGCTTMNLHDRLYAIRDGRLEAIWDIAGRGKVR